MKLSHSILLLLSIFLLTTSFQCDKCHEGDFKLKGTRVWLPLKGQTQMTFIDELGSVLNFQIKVIDTLQTYNNNECSSQFRSESIVLTLYLNSTQTDSIWVQLGPPMSVSLHASSTDTLYMSSGRFFNSPPSNVVIPLSNYKVGGKLYNEVILFKANEGNNKSTDSIVLAKDFGVVAFKYKSRNYTRN